ncbi:MAG: SnoaL-like domain-containing protein [Phycisphaerales bacterium]
MSAYEVGLRLVELCKAGKNREAIEQLYSDDHVAVEAADLGPMGRRFEGKEALLTMTDQFFEMNEIHGHEVEGPWPHDDAFICTMSLDMTPRMGPMEGQRMQVKEACHYTVKDGKINSSSFFYAPSPDCTEQS